MTPYWSMWAIILIGTLLSRQRATDRPDEVGPGFLLVILLLWLMIGLRWKIGGDWFNYIRIFDWTRISSADRVIERGDLGYAATNLLAAWAGASIWLVNLINAGLFIAGLFALTRRLADRWLALLVAFPYLIVVVAMGYTRQSAAIGCLMLGLASFLRTGSLLRYVVWVGVAALFHKTAVIALPLLVFVADERRIVNILLLLSATVGLYFAVVVDSTDLLIKSYIISKYSSSGAAIRVSMCVVPALLFFAARGRLGFDEREQKLWRNFSIAALLSAAALLVSPSSTAVDRIALYLLPMQFVILTRLPGTLVSRQLGRLLVIAYCGVVLFTWLNYAVNAKFWLPYQFWLTAQN